MTKNPNQFNGWEFVITPRGNDRFEFSFYKLPLGNEPSKELTWAGFLSLCESKDSDFNTIFRQVLNQATDKLGAYFWECLPVSAETTDRPFRFVVTKNEELKSMKQDFNSFIAPEIMSKFKITGKGPQVISFLTNNPAKDGILVIPSPYENQRVVSDHNKNISESTKHAPVERQLELWKETASQLFQELNKNDGPRWLSTHGLGSGTRYLHVRIYNNPKYYSYSEYQKFDKDTPVPEIPRPQNPNPNPNPNPSSPNQESQKESKWYKPTDYPGAWTIGILAILFSLVFVFLLIQKKKKKKKN